MYVAVLTERCEEVRLESEAVGPEPDARASTLRPEAAVRVESGLRDVVGQVRLPLGVGVLGLVDGAAEVRQPERTEEADADRDEGQRQQQRRGHEERVLQTHRAADLRLTDLTTIG